jgi:SpoVK/Ycf46/Vps4 family AAA+-type ATPase
MSEEKDKNFVNYKFNDLKVYGSTEWLADGKKKYQTVFEASDLAYLYAELSFYNKLFDEKPWKVKVNLKCHEMDHTNAKVKEVCNVEVNREVLADENVVYIREGWGNATHGQFWKKGKYMWEAYLDDVMIGSRTFYVEDAGKVTAEGNPYFSTNGLRLFEGPTTLPIFKDRVYYTKFKGVDTRYVWGEYSFNNLNKGKSWWAEIFYCFYNDARQLKGKTSEVVLIPEGTETYTLCSGWGSDSRGTWYNDKYTLEIVFMDNLIAIVPYEVGEAYEEGETQPMVPVLGQVVAGAPVQTPGEKTLEELMAELDALIGLDGIKKKVKETTQYLNFLKVRKEKGFDEAQKVSMHAVFTGNPGTGKTTVALMLGKIYQKMGLLPKGHVHEVDRADLVGEFIGQTAPKVKEAINKARGGILFIDEAYSLARSGDDGKDFGREVIEVLLKEMSDGKGDLAVIVAGYPKEMSTFLNSNPGLKSRFNLYFEFPDYLPQELMEIGHYSMKAKKVKMTESGEKYFYEKVVDSYRNRDRSFGNARMVNGIVEEAKMNMGLRLMNEGNLDSLTEDEMSTIQIQDLEKIWGEQKKRLADIPIDEELLRESLNELNSLTGMNNVKHEIIEIVKLVRFYREIGRDVTSTFSLHTVFTGNPGTGKTTVARILARIFKALGILEKGHIVECDRQGLVGGFVGQTAIKTSEQLDAAMGGVLFIDEAYALSQNGGNDFGKEAIETILKRMEDQRGKFIVVAAGYPDNMREFLESNPGLKSRFDKEFQFEDYSADELFEIAANLLKKDNLQPEDRAEKHLRTYFSFLLENKDKFFGNARSVRKVVEESVKNQHLRLAAMESNRRTPEMLNTLLLEDVAEFTPDKEKLSSKSRTKIGFSGGGTTSAQ